MIGPVLGKDGQTNGIIQFINKIDENGNLTEVTEKDEKKFNDMKELIGMCIDNTKKISKTIKTTLKITDRMGKINELMNQEEEATQNHSGPNSGDLL